MSRTAVDLPDPLQTQGDGAMNNADDLLAQLAGEEVDRLLSEADVAAPLPAVPGKPAVVTPAAPTPSSAPAPAAQADVPAPAPKLPALDEEVVDEAEVALHELFEEVNDAADDADDAGAPHPGNADAPVPAAGASAEEMIARGADVLIAEIRRESTEVPPAAGAAPTPSAAEALAAEMEEDERSHTAAIRRMKQGEAAAFKSNQLDEAIANSTEIATAEGELDEAALRVPFLVKLLEWVNAPLAGLPDGVRAAIGKVAIVTSLNAIGVLAYVLIFRRHGHH